MKSQYYKLTHQRYALNSYSKKIFCRDNEEELILNRTLLICSLQYQSVVYFSALTKASNALRQLELNFHNFLSVYSLIPTKYRWLTTVTVCKLKLSYIKSYWHRVIWHNEVLASRVRGMLQQAKGFCCRWKHGGNDRILASECDVIIRTQIRTVCVCVLRTSGWTLQEKSWSSLDRWNTYSLEMEAECDQFEERVLD